MKLVSACLVGIKCRHDGEDALERRVVELAESGELLPVCPEQLGGLPTPREPSRIVGGDGSDVLDRRTKVVTESGRDVTENFIRGAEESLKLARSFNAREAILKTGSPSCGSGEIHDDFTERLRKGDGVTTALLKRNGIRVITENDV